MRGVLIGAEGFLSSKGRGWRMWAVEGDTASGRGGGSPMGGREGRDGACNGGRADDRCDSRVGGG